MPKQFDLEGKRFGKLIVQYREGTKNNNATWYCTCDCGGYTVASTSRLRDGKKTACGCTWGGARKKKTPEERIEGLEKRNKELVEHIARQDKIIFECKGK